MPRGYTCTCDGRVVCHEGGDLPCYPGLLVHGRPEEGSFHDQNLEDATSKINDILNDVRGTRHDQDLAFITAPDGLFLVWVSEGDRADVLRDLLRTEPPA